MVTDTAMVRKNDEIYAFGPVVMELDVFSQLFDKITWIGFHRPDCIGDNTMMPVPSHVSCILLKRSGGNSFKDKLEVFRQSPKMLRIILSQVRRHDVIHSRAPSSPAFLSFLISLCYRKKIWWHKYAGNWAQNHPPFFYGLQRSVLSRLPWGKVTINGRWPGQPSHCLSFENPCLTESDRKEGRKVMSKKSYKLPLKVCFVGRVEEEKGIGRLIQALAEDTTSNTIGSVRIIGTGKDEKRYRQLVKELVLPVHFLGALPRKEVFKVYKECHLIILPTTASEGFPKVLAEASNFGCIPMTSTVASIPQYIRDGREGFLWNYTSESFNEWFKNANIKLEKADLKRMAETSYKFAGLFTFQHYLQRIQNDILN